MVQLEKLNGYMSKYLESHVYKDATFNLLGRLVASVLLATTWQFNGME